MARRLRDLFAALVLVGVLVVLVVVLQRGLSDEPASPPSEIPAGAVPARRSAAGFLDSVGVNVHVTYTDTSYGRFDVWSQRLRDLGVRHVRDGLEPTNPVSTDRLRRLGHSGFRLTLISSLVRSPESQVAYAVGSFGRAVEAIEGPNEVDVSGVSDWPSRMRSFMPALKAAVRRRSDVRPTLLGPTFINQVAGWEEVAGKEARWDVDNLHPYPGGREPSAGLLDEELAIPRRFGSERPVQATETGYHNATRDTGDHAPVSDAAAATYVPRLVLSNFAAGIERSFLYELADLRPDPQRTHRDANFGLLRADLTPKPAFSALRNLLRVVRDAADAKGSPPEVRVEAPRDVRSVLLEHAGGRAVLALWREEPVWDLESRRNEKVAPVRASVEFRGRARDISVHRPSRGARALEGRSEASTVRMPVSADVVLVSFG